MGRVYIYIYTYIFLIITGNMKLFTLYTLSLSRFYGELDNEISRYSFKCSQRFLPSLNSSKSLSLSLSLSVISSFFNLTRLHDPGVD